MSKERLFRLIGQEANRRGFDAQRRVAYLFETDELADRIPAWINGYEQANSHDDHTRGIDGWCDTDVGRIPLQIKSSLTGKREFEQRHSEIPVIISSSDKSLGDLFEHTIEQISTYRDKVLEAWDLKELVA